MFTLLLLAGAAAASPAPLFKREVFQNDVLPDVDFPDPSLFYNYLNDEMYVFATAAGGKCIPYTSTSNFPSRDFAAVQEAFPSQNTPSWAKSCTSWAPDVNIAPNNGKSHWMYYAPELANQTGIHCISLATSTEPGGPYTDSSSEPMICPSADGGAIDPAFYRDYSPADGSCYVLYKIDSPNNHKGHTMCDKSPDQTMTTPIMLQQVDCNTGSPTGGDPTQIYKNNGEEDLWNIEAPSLYRGSDGTYYLFYSSGCYSNNSYTWKYVTSQYLKGPYGNPQPVVQSGEKGEAGPGGADIVLGGSVPGAVAWHSLRGSDIKNGRQLNVGTMQYNGATAQVV